MKKFSSFLVSIMFCLPLVNLAQNNEKIDYSRSITTEELKDHLHYLASDEMAGRLTGSTHFNLAADYAITQFKQAGLKPICIDSSGNKTFKQVIYFNKYEVNQNDSLIFEKNGKKKNYKSPKDYAYYHIMNNTKDNISGNAVFVGYGIHEPELNWNDFEGLNIRDKWVVTFFQWKEKYNKDFKVKIKESGKSFSEVNNNKVEFIKNNGAKGIIGILDDNLDNWEDWVPFYNIKFSAINNQEKIPTGTQWILAGADLTKMLFNDEVYDPLNNRGKYKTYPFDNLKITLKKDIQYSKISSYNVVAYIEGSDLDLKNEFVVLGAHLDHLGILNETIMNGANDNASGCASVLEIAEAVAQSNPKRSVAFILFTAEEKSKEGSKYFVNHSPIDLNSIQLFINLDCIGRPDGDASGIEPNGYNKGNVNLKEILDQINNKSTKLNLDFAYADSSNHIYRSDQYWFYKNNIPVLFFYNGKYDEYHKASDDVEKIDFEFMRKVNVLTYNLIMEVANRKESLRKK